jgi:ribose transport system ATP-binding protein
MQPRPTTDTAATPVVATRAMSKTFAGLRVLSDVALEIQPGEIHGLVGQNGSGKSTLIKILAGYHAPDGGSELFVRGEPVRLPLSPAEPKHLGISFVHQDLGLAETASVLENLRVGRYATSVGRRISWGREAAVTREALERIGSTLDPHATVSSLRDVDRALLAIARALQEVHGRGGGGLLILDEPTAYLPRDATERLFEAIRAVAAAGVGVLFVTHRLEEIQAITDRVSVLRDGVLVGTLETASVSQADLVERILGFSLDRLYPEPHESHGERVMSVQGLDGQIVRDFSVEIERGEILGVTGLVGMGHEELPYLLFGAERARAGALELDGERHDMRRLTPRRAISAGIVLAPANRRRDGGVGDATVRENVTLPSLSNYFRRGRLRARLEGRQVAEMIRDFQVVPPDPEAALGTLSGGNQQKALLAKWFHRNPKVFVIHEPTQGVDIGAKRQIFQLIREAADAGTSFVLASSEYEDLANLCDRVLVLRDGRVVSALHGGALTPERLLEQCFREAEAA